MLFLSHLRKDYLPGLSDADLAAAVNAQHGNADYQLSASDIADLENVYSTRSYPEEALQQMATYLSKQAGRLIEYQDLVSLAGRAVPNSEYVAPAPVVAVEPEAVEQEEPGDTNPALVAIGG